MAGTEVRRGEHQPRITTGDLSFRSAARNLLFRSEHPHRPLETSCEGSASRGITTRDLSCRSIARNLLFARSTHTVSRDPRVQREKGRQAPAFAQIQLETTFLPTS